MISMRPYQLHAAISADNDFRSVDSAMVVMATGLGKTVLFGYMASQWPVGRTLVLAHREELVTQAARTIRDGFGCPAQVEMADEFATFEANLLEGECRAVVASVQSLSQPKRLQRYRPEDFGLVVVDECHHCVPQNKTYWDILKHFRRNPRVKLLGVTATPDRGDELALGQVFERVSYRMDIADGISEGWLVPVEQQFVTVQGLDLSAVRLGADGDLRESEVEQILRQEQMLHRVAAPLVDIAGGEQCLVFCPGVKYAAGCVSEGLFEPGLVDVLNRHAGVSAAAVHGKTDKATRRRELAAYSRKDYQFLVGCDVFTEGFDEPAVSVVGIAKKTKVRSKYAQMVGRGTRPLREIVAALNAAPDAAARRAVIAASAKPRALIVDFVGQNGRHKLASLADLLGGNHAPEVRERANDIAAKKGGAVRVDADLFAEAEGQLAREASEREQARLRDERRAAEERHRRERVAPKAVYAVEGSDPFGGGDAPPERGGFGRTADPATEKQVEFLRRHDPKFIEANPTPTKAKAGERIGQVKERWDRGLCSVKQAAALARGGLNPDVSREHASALMELLAARNWRPVRYAMTGERFRIRREPDGFAPVVLDADVGRVEMSPRFATEAECREFIAGMLVAEGVAA